MNLLERILAEHGYEPIQARGMVSGVRPDGSKLSMFSWSNMRHAESELIPRSYLVVELDGVRWRLPKVAWEPFTLIAEQRALTSKEIRTEFEAIFAPMLGLPWEKASAILGRAGERYDMGANLSCAMSRANLEWSGYHVAATPVFTPRRNEVFVYGQGNELVLVDAQHKREERRLTLAGLGWDDVTAWLVAQTSGGAS
ncbi:hypothetical protein [Leucobacter sp. cx-169]|uniref:hypothetical protein n=1 Tax=Leucobacter sp. cx-169 TaxID=2770549 RepID=UPI00165E285E|nr:hypothetical protein [Leucobacter sp. cx-169]MBC9927297.1 hypothetical protein [Leucobacter sp. cx-169]